MFIHVDRLEADEKATRGKLYIDGVFECYTLEDQHRVGEKVYGETRIPAGTYKLELYPHGTKFHPKYLQSYGADFHKGMLRVCDVPGFEGVLIHKGNYHDDTEGCLLIGTSKMSGKSKRDTNGKTCIAVGGSEGAYKGFYPKVRDALLRGETVTIQYSDSDVAARNTTHVREQEAKSNAGLVAAATGVSGVLVVAGAASDLVGVDESSAALPAGDEGAALPAEDLAAAPAPPAVPEGATVAPATAEPNESNLIEIGLIVVGAAIVLFALYLGYRRWREWRQR